jgi:hypothetical protein
MALYEADTQKFTCCFHGCESSSSNPKDEVIGPCTKQLIFVDMLGALLK